MIEVTADGCALMDSIEHQLNFLSNNQLFIQHLLDQQLISAVEVTADGLLLSPLQARNLALEMIERYGWTFNREREGTLYKWVTSSAEFNCRIIIDAGENIDLTGSIITFPQTPQQ
jgi:hypothetical protein